MNRTTWGGALRPRRAARPRTRTTSALSVAIFLAAGIFLLVVGLLRRSEAQPVADGARTTGTVVAVRTYAGHRSDSYRAEVRYVTGAGRVEQILGPSVSSRPAVGTSVPISYDRADPGRAHELIGDGDAWFAIPAGIVFVVIAAGLGVRVVQRRREATSGDRALRPGDGLSRYG